MTPPPTTTISARAGSWFRDGCCATSSTTVRHLGEQPRELRAPEGGLRLVEPLLPPAVEVEVHRAGGRLDEPPERPAVLAAQGLQADPGQIGAAGILEVGLDPRLDLLRTEVALRGGVAELEA